MIHIEIKTTEIDSFSGNSKKDGKPFSIRSQIAFAHTFDKHGAKFPYPQQIKIQLEDDQLAFPIGNYTIAPQCLYVDKFGGLKMGRLALVPIQASVQRAA
jgi:hypothetical protein